MLLVHSKEIIIFVLLLVKVYVEISDNNKNTVKVFVVIVVVIIMIINDVAISMMVLDNRIWLDLVYIIMIEN